LNETIFSDDDYAFIGQDAWTHFTDNRKIEYHRFKDLSKKLKRVKNGKIVLVTHHALIGILDRGISYPKRSWEDKNGYLHGGNSAIRKIIEQHKPSIHIFAHIHSDGGKWELYNETLFVNVCHLERTTKKGKIGVNGSFIFIDSRTKTCIPHHLSNLQSKICDCGAVHYLNYRRCFNCYRRGRTVINYQELDA